jgi:1-phosphofructokinase family hexose kinase
MTIVCVTPNPTIDRTLRVPGFGAGGVWRATAVRAACGGKGVNVARALTRLRCPSLCLGPLGGAAGRAAAASAAAEGLAARWTLVAGETRTCIIVVGEAGATTVINEPGPELSGTEWAAVIAAVDEEARRARAVCISGSLTPGCSTETFARLLEAASVSSPPWVDTSGAPLAVAVAAGASVKVNADEAGALLDGRIGGVADAVAAARALRVRGSSRVVITLGADGAVLATADGLWHVAAPPVAVVSAVGSGDCFLAGLVAHLADGASIEAALALAAACGAADTLRPEVAAFTAAEVTELAAAAAVRPLAG